MSVRTYCGPAGIQLASDTYGDPDGPAVLLLHGRGRSRAIWREVASALADAGRFVVSLDLRGHGDSESPADDRYGFDDYIADVRAVLETFESRPVVIGVSLGAWIATGALGEGGEHLATGVVIVDAPMSANALGALKSGIASQHQADKGGSPNRDPRSFDGIDLAALEERLTKAAAAIKMPAFVIHFERSPLATSADMRELSDLIPAAEYAELADIGERAQSGETDAFNALVLDFLERRVPREPPEYVSGSDSRTLRDALGCFGTGVTVVTTTDRDGNPVGLTANSFTSVSLDPPLHLFCLAQRAGSLAAFEAAGCFAVNVLHIGQQPVSGRFASQREDRFATTAWEVWDTGSPIIQGSLASFDCTKESFQVAGDHVVVIGRVQRVRFEPRRDPLIYFRGRYRRLHFT